MIIVVILLTSEWDWVITGSAWCKCIVPRSHTLLTIILGSATFLDRRVGLKEPFVRCLVFNIPSLCKARALSGKTISTCEVWKVIEVARFL